MVFLRRRGKKFKAIRFYDADFYNSVYGNLRKSFHEKLLFFVRQSKRFTWRVSSKINPYKLRKRKRSPRSLKFLTKQQLKYFLGTLKEYQFRFLYRRVIGYKRAHLRKSFSFSLVRFLEGRLDSFLFKYNLAKPFNIQNVLSNNIFSLNDGNVFLKRKYLLNTGDRYSLSSFLAFKFYVKKNLKLVSFFKKKKKKLGRKRSLFVGRWKLRFFKKKRRFFLRVFKAKRRRSIKRLFSFAYKNLFSLSRIFNFLRPHFFLFKRIRFFSSFTNFISTLRKRLFKLRKYRKIPTISLFLKRAFLFNILRFRRFIFYKFYGNKKRNKRRLNRFYSRVLPFKPWSLFMKWRVGYLLPDPFLQLIFFLEQPGNPKDMLFSFSFNLRNLLFVYQSIK